MQDIHLGSFLADNSQPITFEEQKRNAAFAKVSLVSITFFYSTAQLYKPVSTATLHRCWGGGRVSQPEGTGTIANPTPSLLVGSSYGAFPPSSPFPPSPVINKLPTGKRIDKNPQVSLLLESFLSWILWMDEWMNEWINVLTSLTRGIVCVFHPVL